MQFEIVLDYFLKQWYYSLLGDGMELLYALIGLLFGIIISMLFFQKKFAKVELERLDQYRLHTDLKANYSSLQTSYTLEQKHQTEKLEQLEQSKKNLEKEFEQLSQTLLSQQSIKNEKNMLTLLQPLQQQIQMFQQQVQNVHVAQTKDSALLIKELSTMHSLNQQMHNDALNLTKALKGENKTQGNWGEVVLERLLESVGLQKGINYTTQTSFTVSQAKRLQPDVIVSLPENREVIIDSKVTLTAYERYVSTDDEPLKQEALKEHIRAILSHINGLSAKEYEAIEEVHSLDFVVMFLPVESAFITAINFDETIITKAIEKNIILATPSTLLAVLRIIRTLWHQENQNTNALEIAKKAGQMYDKLIGFSQDFENVGTHMARAQKSYDDAFNKFSTGRGNLVKQAQDLKALGVAPKKEFSASLLSSHDE